MGPLFRLADTGVRVLDIELARIGPHDDPRDLLPVLEAGAELGARHVIARLPDPDRTRKTDHLAQLCDLARPLGLTVDLEFPSRTETPTSPRRPASSGLPVGPTPAS